MADCGWELEIPVLSEMPLLRGCVANVLLTLLRGWAREILLLSEIPLIREQRTSAGALTAPFSRVANVLLMCC